MTKRNYRREGFPDSNIVISLVIRESEVLHYGLYLLNKGDTFRFGHNTYIYHSMCYYPYDVGCDEPLLDVTCQMTQSLPPKITMNKENFR